MKQWPYKPLRFTFTTNNHSNNKQLLFYLSLVFISLLKLFCFYFCKIFIFLIAGWMSEGILPDQCFQKWQRLWGFCIRVADQCLRHPHCFDSSKLRRFHPFICFCQSFREKKITEKRILWFNSALFASILEMKNISYAKYLDVEIGSTIGPFLVKKALILV